MYGVIATELYVGRSDEFLGMYFYFLVAEYLTYPSDTFFPAHWILLFMEHMMNVLLKRIPVLITSTCLEIGCL